MATDDFMHKLTAVFGAPGVDYSHLIGEGEMSRVKTVETYRELI